MIVGTCERCRLPVLETDAHVVDWARFTWHTRCHNAEQADERAEREWEDAQERETGEMRCPPRE